MQEPMVGAYAFSSKKAARGHADRGTCLAHIFVMHVAEELTTWPESTERKRVWVSSGVVYCMGCYITTLKHVKTSSVSVMQCPADEAVDLCRHDWMKEALQAWLQKQHS